MSETDDALDKAKERVQAQAEPPATRPKDPSYHVFRQTQPGQFTLLTDESNPVKASSRKDAIQKVLPSKAADDHASDTFLVIAEKELKLLTRTVKTEVVETIE